MRMNSWFRMLPYHLNIYEPFRMMNDDDMTIFFWQHISQILSCGSCAPQTNLQTLALCGLSSTAGIPISLLKSSRPNRKLTIWWCMQFTDCSKYEMLTIVAEKRKRSPALRLCEPEQSTQFKIGVDLFTDPGVVDNRTLANIAGFLFNDTQTVWSTCTSKI